MNNLVYTFNYQHDYIPAKPMVEVGLSLPGSSVVKTMTAILVDSGADNTMIAVDVLHSIGAKSIDHVRVRGIFGVSRSTDLYIVDLHIGIHRIRARRWRPYLRAMKVFWAAMCLTD